MGSLFRKISEWLGCSEGQAQRLVGGFVFILVLGGYLAVTAGIQLEERYGGENPGEGITKNDTESLVEEARNEVIERVKLPTFLSEGQPVPDAPLRSDGTVLRCSPLLQGESGLIRGWLWINEERGCRRVAPQTR